MDFPFYQKEQREPPSHPVELPPSHPSSEIRPETYMPDDGLVDAVNVALLLGQPLLLTGEPGTGKTHLASHVAWQFGFPVHKFETKSDSNATDLFYLYDALRHFHAVQVAQARHQASPEAKDYLEYTALGRAILLTNEKEPVKRFLPESFPDWGKPQRSVVLIDEIDKAPRDFPNDILNEVEHLSFSVPELGTSEPISVGNAQLKPILILTSNSEKHLPAAFLRRCIYYNIPFPEPEALRIIVEKRLGQWAKHHSQLLTDAFELFNELRAAELQKNPATAELLNWLMTAHQLFDGRNRTPYRYPDDLLRTLSALVKNTEDQEIAQDIFNDWINHKKQ